MRRLAATLAALALAGAAAGCGGDDEGEPIPAQQAEPMLDQLDNIERQVAAGNCGSAEFQVTGDGELQDKVAALPDDVDADVRSALEDGVDRLLDLVEEQCGEDEEERTDTEETDTQETETQETETETQPTETEETETQPTETETQPTETQPPPETPELPPPGEDGGTGPTPEEGGGAPSPNADAGRGSG